MAAITQVEEKQQPLFSRGAIKCLAIVFYIVSAVLFTKVLINLSVM